jgi:hypothetical protein
MRTRNTGRGVEEACRMLHVFGSVGVCGFDLTRTDLDGHKCDYRGAQSINTLCGWMPQLMEMARERQQNLIVRPRCGLAQLVQLDDLCASQIRRMGEAAFLVLATSPGSYQAWVAVRPCGEDLARRLRRGSGADLYASGATRIAGSVNFKPAYAPDFPIVQMIEARRQWIVSEGKLEAAGLVAAPEMRVRIEAVRVAPSGRAKAWPSYERCLRNAPLRQRGNRPDTSRADFTFCLLAIDWGWSIEETRQRLLEKSSKARENGDRYARRTAERAAEAVDRRSGSREISS